MVIKLKIYIDIIYIIDEYSVFVGVCHAIGSVDGIVKQYIGDVRAVVQRVVAYKALEG